MRLQTDRGFTVVELLIAVVVIGVVLTMALPRISGIRQGMVLDGAAQQLVGDLRRARIEALKRNRSLRVVLTGTTGYSIDSIGYRGFEGGVAFSSGPDSVRFASFGPPVSGPATFILQLGSRTKQVTINGVGLVEVK